MFLVNIESSDEEGMFLNDKNDDFRINVLKKYENA